MMNRTDYPIACIPAVLLGLQSLTRPVCLFGLWGLKNQAQKMTGDCCTDKQHLLVVLRIYLVRPH